ncbi:MAG TPA: hypothetical protein VKE92_14960 [Anaerolineales bacterium]|nr:hypothetical protein [Anaerolineales bacterium]
MLETLYNKLENALIKRGSHPQPLGYQKPKDLDHIQKYPLSALSLTEIPRVPMSMGIDWYSNFDQPEAVQFGSLTRYFVGRGKLGRIRGGHCVCIKSGNFSDRLQWWDFYDQGAEGACVGFGNSRMMTLMNRVRYNPWWLWDHCKIIDEWADTNPGDDNGTSDHAAADVMRTQGMVKWDNSMGSLSWQERDAIIPDPAAGIAAARWAQSVDEIRDVLQSSLNDQLQAIPFLNSWGRYYPHITWMPYIVVEKLIDDGGEFLVPTDR